MCDDAAGGKLVNSSFPLPSTAECTFVGCLRPALRLWQLLCAGGGAEERPPLDLDAGLWPLLRGKPASGTGTYAVYTGKETGSRE